MNCPKCGGPMMKNGHTKEGKQKWFCRSCKFYPENPAPEQPEKHPSVGLSEEQLRAKHDIRFIIATKLKELSPGVFLSRSEFVQFCGIRSGQGYSDVIEHPNFDAYHGKAGGVVYFSHPESIKKLKSEGVLT